MENIGDRLIIGNPEDTENLSVLELYDVHEVSPTETFFEIIEYRLVDQSLINFGRSSL